MAHTYILKTAKGSYYIGSTENLKERMLAHQSGSVFSTKSRLPVTLVYTEEFPTRADAQQKEYRIKKWKSKKLIESLIRKRGLGQFMARSSIG